MANFSVGTDNVTLNLQNNAYTLTGHATDTFLVLIPWKSAVHPAVT